MTWNLWWRFGPWQEREAAILAVCRAVDPDVVMLQEVWGADGDSAAHRIATALGYHVALSDDPFADRRTATGAGFHNAIVSRWPIDQVVSHALPRLDGTAGHRRALSAAIDTPFGRWPVLSTHLDHRFDESAVRQLQCERILQIVDEIRGNPDVDPPVVVGGDFNATPDSDEIRLLTGRRTAPVRNLVLSDCWEHVGDGAGVTWRSDNPYQAATAWPDRRLDYVFVSWPRPKPFGNPVRAWLAGTGPIATGDADPVVASDHAAVVVELFTGSVP